LASERSLGSEDVVTHLEVAVGALLLTGTASFLVTPFTARLARRFGILDRPEQGLHKTHAQATPYLGGVAIFLGMLVGAPLLLLAGQNRAVALVGDYAPVIGIAVALALVGLADDVWSLPRSVRVVAQVGAAVGAWGFGFRVSSTPWPAFNFLATIFWIVGITNAFNLLDNMDGLSAGLAGVGALSFAVLGAFAHLSVVTTVSAALAGAAFGFLAHNRHPAKVFMGDAGSLFLGFLLAVIGIELEFKNLVEVTFLVPVVVLGLPIFDTTLVVLSRLRNRRPIFKGARDHLSHRLIRIGLPVKAAVGLLYWAGLCLGWLGLVISRSNLQVGWMLLGFVMALGIFFGALLWNVPVYEEDPGYSPLPREAIEADELQPS
jgi:UDP-GlcNAc:undecaprenyl-phosphate GlcNAc-1-phosphate transferase